MEDLCCTKCNSKFKTRDGLTNHLKRKTPCDKKPTKSDDNDLHKFYRKLDPSDKRFNPKSCYMCIICEGLFKSPSNLRVHVESVHLRRKPFSCDDCRSTFTTNCSLKRHVDVTHLKLKSLQCHLV